MPLSRRSFLAGTALGLAGAAVSAAPAAAGAPRILSTTYFDDFTTAPNGSVVGRDLPSGNAKWWQLNPPPTTGVFSPTGDPSLENGFLIMGKPEEIRMYPCVRLSGLPTSWEVWFAFGSQPAGSDPRNTAAVGIHLWADQDGKCAEVPLHCSISENKIKVGAHSRTLGDPDRPALIPFGDGPMIKADWPQPLPTDTLMRIGFTRVDDTLTIELPSQTGLADTTLDLGPEPRLTGAVFEGSPRRFLVLEDQQLTDLARPGKFRSFTLTV